MILDGFWSPDGKKILTLDENYLAETWKETDLYQDQGVEKMIYLRRCF